MGKITDYSAITALTSGNVLLVDGTGGTKKISANLLTKAFAEISDDVNIHRNTYGGRSLGTSVSAEQWAQITAGTFHGMLVGDYWTIGGVNWLIADFDYWLHCGDTECTDHHVVIIPEKVLYNANMNDKVDNTDVTTGAYIGSKMYTTNLADAKTSIDTAFGAAHILSHKSYFANAVSNGYESGGTWVASKVDLMNEKMVYGCEAFHNVVHGTAFPTNYTIDKTQLAIFRLDPTKIVAYSGASRAHWWLRDVASATAFAAVADSGVCSSGGASNSLGVRPAFGIFAS